MNNSALILILSFLKKIEQSPDNVEIVNVISDYIFLHQELLSDDDISLELINTLSDHLHGKTKSTNAIYSSLYLFWLSYIIKSKIDIFYVGDIERVKYLVSKLKKNSH